MKSLFPVLTRDVQGRWKQGLLGPSGKVTCPVSTAIFLSLACNKWLGDLFVCLLKALLPDSSIAVSFNSSTNVSFAPAVCPAVCLALGFLGPLRSPYPGTAHGPLRNRSSASERVAEGVEGPVGPAPMLPLAHHYSFKGH